MKPTSKEIAGWLREAAVIAHEDALDFGCFEDEAREHAKMWHERATLVESKPDSKAINQELVEALEQMILSYKRSTPYNCEEHIFAETTLTKAKEGM